MSAVPYSKLPNGRLVPVDLTRSLAAYGVVVMHTSLGAGIAASAATANFQQFFIFAVPFFLAAAFYFTKLPADPDEVRRTLKQRTARLLWPYAFWTLIYLLARLAKYAAAHDFPKIQETLCGDPLGLVFMGGAAVHLYFLPMLLIGTVLMLGMSPLIRRCSFFTLSIVLVFSIVLNTFLYHPFFVIGFSPSLPPWSEGWLAGWTASGERLLAFSAACLIRCFPYICFAIWIRTLLGMDLHRGVKWFVGFFMGTAFLVLSLHPISGLPGSVWEIIMGFGPLLFAMVLSSARSGQNWITQLGELSFGIYLCHHLIMEALQMLAGKALPLSLQGSLPYYFALTLAGFVISAALMLGVSRLGHWPRQLCGLR